MWGVRTPDGSIYVTDSRSSAELLRTLHRGSVIMTRTNEVRPGYGVVRIGEWIPVAPAEASLTESHDFIGAYSICEVCTRHRAHLLHRRGES